MSNLKFLKDRLSEVENRMAQTPDGVEAKVLERMIDELYGKNKQESSYITRNYPCIRKKSTEGNKIKRVYEAITEIVMKSGGEISIPVLGVTLKTKYPEIYKILGTGNRPNSKNTFIPTYVNAYNKASVQNKKIEMFPCKIPGKITRYESVVTAKELLV